jgi:hypothetical protein
MALMFATEASFRISAPPQQLATMDSLVITYPLIFPARAVTP